MISERQYAILTKFSSFFERTQTQFILRQKQPSEMFCKKGVLKNFLNFTGKHLFWSLLCLD